MRKSFILAIFIVITLFFSPINIHAKTLENVSKDVNVLQKIDNSFLNVREVHNLKKKTTTAGGNVSSCDAILGSTQNEDSVAWLIQKILDYARVIGPILVFVLSSIDFAKVIILSDDDSMAKAKKKLGIRIILIVALFLIPTITEVLLDTFGVITHSACGFK